MDAPPNWTIHSLAAVSSTQVEVRRRLSKGERAPFAVAAETQTEGRGRRGRSWLSPRGGLWVSLAIEHPAPADPFFSLIAAEATRSAVAGLLPSSQGSQLTLKWPNDLLLNDRKWGGLLAEVEPSPSGVWILLGIGLDLDVSADLLPEPTLGAIPATSLLTEFGQAPSPTSVLPRILWTLEELWAEDQSPGGRDRSIARISAQLSTLGQVVTWREREDSPAESHPRGRAIGLQRDGGLEVELLHPDRSTDERRVLRAGEVTHLRTPSKREDPAERERDDP